MLTMLTPAILFQQALQIANWNARVVQSIPKVPPEMEKLNHDVKEYLSRRKHVFNDFKVAAEKLAAAVLQSGYWLVFQLAAEVRRLQELILHEVEELLPFLHELATHFPETESLFHALRMTLEQVRSEMKASEQGGEAGAENYFFGFSKAKRDRRTVPGCEHDTGDGPSV